MNRNLIIGIAIAAVLGVLVFWGVGKYNGLVAAEQQVESQWAQVENVYQRRADLVPNLVETVKGAAAHERETLEAVTAARAKVGSAGAAAPPTIPRRSNSSRRRNPSSPRRSDGSWSWSRAIQS